MTRRPPLFPAPGAGGIRAADEPPRERGQAARAELPGVLGARPKSPLALSVHLEQASA
ncbi:hypothetical protein [Streptomyces sp. NPDC102283]|uniref:hypothetical protein n=1 Tax=Streptomyces sp. NPDC102283 TaxID=3366155 RepID=UPI0037F33F27